MGDIIHTLPAVASLKTSYPGSRLTWAIEPKWAPLLEGNPFVDRVALLRRDMPAGLIPSWRALRAERYDFAVDFQGLIKSALTASAARPERIFGFHQTQVRERLAALFYSNKTTSHSSHVVERNLDLAASAGAAGTLLSFPIPAGYPEGELPQGDFVLASPLAGWRAKRWPIDHYRALGARLRSEFGISLVLNGPPGAPLSHIRETVPHFSGMPGLIHATRRAAAILGVDSGPMHLAAALGKRGIAIFGPTDPARNGPWGGSLEVLRSPQAETTYDRAAGDSSMQQISPDQVFEALRPMLLFRRRPANALA
jgi:heptosyltransferase-1